MLVRGNALIEAEGKDRAESEAMFAALVEYHGIMCTEHDRFGECNWYSEDAQDFNDPHSDRVYWLDEYQSSKRRVESALEVSLSDEEFMARVR